MGVNRLGFLISLYISIIACGIWEGHLWVWWLWWWLDTRWVGGRRVQEYGFGRDIVMVGAAMPLPLKNTESSILRREKVIIMWGAFGSCTVWGWTGEVAMRPQAERHSPWSPERSLTVPQRWGMIFKGWRGVGGEGGERPLPLPLHSGWVGVIRVGGERPLPLPLLAERPPV